jgi:two-component system, NarL family, sensor kinase
MLVPLTRNPGVAGTPDPPTAGEQPAGRARRTRVRLRPARWSGRRVAAAQFLLCSVAVLLVVGTIGALALREVATGRALENARAVTEALARGVVAPEITAEVLEGDAAALARLDRIVHMRVLMEPTIRLKVWTRDGRIAYSDAAELIGERHPSAPALRKGFASESGYSRISDPANRENRFERSQGRLVEVYMPVETPSGQVVAVETYRRAGSIDAETRKIWGQFLPVLLLVVLALAAAQLPLAAVLARRIRQTEREQERLVRRAEDKLEAERLRIAAELHDGVVQDLVGVSYELRAMATGLPDDPSAKPGQSLGDVLRRSDKTCRAAVQALRDLLVELHPGDRRVESLEAAIERLAKPMRARGLVVSVAVALEREPPADVAELVHRTVQEALRNVDRHAGAREVEVELEDDGTAVSLEVRDDGRGMTADDLEEQQAAGHMGLRLLADGLAARGGSLVIESEPGTGTRLSVWLPWG